MCLPNLLIAGSQKCGTTWLFHCLKKSNYIFTPDRKELNFFNRKSFHGELDNYKKAFFEGETFRYRLESTPHYFQLPGDRGDIAKNIQVTLGEPKIILMFRNPIERYESAYIHHMMEGRIEYSDTIDSVKDDYKMISFGKYASIYKHWSTLFPGMHSILYDDVRNNKVSVIDSVMTYLEMENDIGKWFLNKRVNEKRKKFRNLEFRRIWTRIPELSKTVKRELLEIYRNEIDELEEIVNRDLSHWKAI